MVFLWLCQLAFRNTILNNTYEKNINYIIFVFNCELCFYRTIKNRTQQSHRQHWQGVRTTYFSQVLIFTVPLVQHALQPAAMQLCGILLHPSLQAIARAAVAAVMHLAVKRVLALIVIAVAVELFFVFEFFSFVKHFFLYNCNTGCDSVKVML